MPLVNLNDLKELELAKGVAARVANTDTVSIAHVHLVAGALVPEHTHHHVQVVNVIDGELELTVDGDTTILSRGRVMVLPSNVTHSGQAITDCYVVDVFSPVREDFVAMAEGTMGARPYGKD